MHIPTAAFIYVFYVCPHSMAGDRKTHTLKRIHFATWNVHLLNLCTPGVTTILWTVFRQCLGISAMQRFRFSHTFHVVCELRVCAKMSGARTLVSFGFVVFIPQPICIIRNFSVRPQRTTKTVFNFFNGIIAGILRIVIAAHRTHTHPQALARCNVRSAISIAKIYILRA